MMEHPIPFSGEMVRAILGGRKTQTRRVVRRSYTTLEGHAWAVCPARDSGWVAWFGATPLTGVERATTRAYAHGFPCPYGVAGDSLWVKETWRSGGGSRDAVAALAPDRIHYRADEDEDPAPGCWRSPRYMPRWASRITLDVVSVRVERVQAISEDDAVAEGVAPCLFTTPHDCVGTPGARCSFARLWSDLNGKRPGCGWDESPWVWAVEFRRR